MVLPILLKMTEKVEKTFPVIFILAECFVYL